MRSLGVHSAGESQDEPPAPAADAAAETDDADSATGAGYLAMLRAALARCGQPAAAATVWAWLQVSNTPVHIFWSNPRLHSLP